MVVIVKAASLNFPDVLIIQNKYQFKPPLPFSPGSEMAGVVKEVGEGVKRLQARRPRHGLHRLRRVCRGSEAGRRAPGADSGRHGLHDSAAAFLLTYGTSDHALRDRAQLEAGETLLVLGAAGGVGLAAIEIGKALGASVIACASSDDKLEVCKQHGADATINYASEDLRERIKALTGGKASTWSTIPSAGTYTEPALRSIAWRGRLLVVGFAAGEIPKIPLNLTLLKGCSIVGVFWGDFARREPQRSPRASASSALVPRGQAQAARVADLSARAGGRGAEADGCAESEGKGRPDGLGLVPSPLPEGGCIRIDVDPAAEFVACRAQVARAHETQAGMQRDGGRVGAVADHGDDLAVVEHLQRRISSPSTALPMPLP